ncbi:MAG: sigma-54-dependent Fis family transcriptional regulator [Verrucomicrobiales bacterium]|nr:sigma-54-dependent Fis family transcriptional regulator [Verrucomicrobiales bacterium]MCP5527581.1 sigma-54-dependent Fis family transcriptional regulator [Verrucomicrobiales bacterium]
MRRLVLWHIEGEPELAARLASLGERASSAGDSRILPLGPGSAELVYLVAHRLLLTAGWARLRVELSQAARLFVVAGSGLTTGAIMQAARDGAYDVLDLADPDARWRESLDRAVAAQQLWLRLYSGSPLDSSGAMIGESPPMRELRQTLARVGAFDVRVMILGESGVGKELVARALHDAGGGGGFVALNCAAIPKDLLEAELFGVDKGAFTGALRSRPGLVEQAAHGTLFLDEIGEMDLALQPKLLRFLETRTARRVGGTQDYRVETRVVAATNRDLQICAAAGGFRSDLYYRLAEVVVQVPPLRERRPDIPLLVRRFLELANERFGKNLEGVEPELLAALQQYDWPGNVRELKSVIDRLVLLFDGPLLRAGCWEVPRTPAPAEADAAPAMPAGGSVRSQPEAVRIAGRAERMALARRLLAEGAHSLGEIAARTGVHPTTLFRWRKAGTV